MKTPAEARRILAALEKHHPNADTELAYRNAFELLVATMLSAQSTDKRVNEVTPALFARYPERDGAARGRLGRARGADPLHRLLPSEGARAPRHGRHPGQPVRRRSAGVDGRAGRAARRGPQDGERRPRPRAGRAGPARGSARAARHQSPRPGALRRSDQGRGRARRAVPEEEVDAGLRHVHPARPAHLQADAALQGLQRPARLRLRAADDARTLSRARRRSHRHHPAAASPRK